MLNDNLPVRKGRAGVVRIDCISMARNTPTRPEMETDETGEENNMEEGTNPRVNTPRRIAKARVCFAKSSDKKNLMKLPLSPMLTTVRVRP